METIIKDVLKRLETITELKYIGADDGQIDQMDENNQYPVLFPAALIDVEGVDWTTTNDPKQSGQGNIVVRFAWLSPNRFDNNISDARLTETITRWTVHDKICKKLHGWSGTTTGRLERIRTDREKREGLLKVITITFAFEGTEDLTNT